MFALSSQPACTRTVSTTLRIIAGGVPQRRHRLRLADTVDRAHLQLMLACREPHDGMPYLERVAAKVGTKLRCIPGSSVIARQRNFRDPVAAIEGDAPYERLGSGIDLGAIGQIRDERAHVRGA